MSEPICDLELAQALNDRFFSGAPEAAQQKADLELIWLLEQATNDLDAGKELRTPIARRLVESMRRLLVDLFRLRTERDRYRAELHLLEQGQELLKFQLPQNPQI